MPRPARTLPPEVLTASEATSLMAACGDSWVGTRNRALLAVMYRSGLRVSEALALEPKDIDLDRGAVRVLRGKGGRARTVGIDPYGSELVADWRFARQRVGLAVYRPLFCTGAGRAMTSAQARRLLTSLGLRAGIAKRVHPHGLRHTHAAELRSEGVDIGIISKQLGHRSIATTATYLDHIAPTQVIETIARRTSNSETRS